MNDQQKVYIVILNWNGWKDTIECLESVFQNTYHNYKVIVCDNNSSDNSLLNIKKWANGKEFASKFSTILKNEVKKALIFKEYTKKEAECGGREDEDCSLILIQNGKNLGFAGGNNVALKYVLAKNDFKYVWLLNNDTVIHPDALQYLVDRMKCKKEAGICGSTLLYYHQPNKIQALGGATYNKWLGLSKHLGVGKSYPLIIDTLFLEKKIDYVIGASMLVSKEFLCEIGLICEDYFLYYEEIDWAIRAKRKYSLAYASKSIVYHKEGSSIGSSSNPKEKSLLSDYYAIKNRIVFTKKYFKYALPFVYLGLIITIINRIKRNQWKRVKMIINIIQGKRGI